ncbi:MAG: polysaccharide biosynthesis/export family protein [bacterium]|nr:polysaccharide biosynthesis/export family protein [bacterium]
MSLGQGSRKRTPAWIWVVFIVGLATVLPGAAQIVAQEENQQPDGARFIAQQAQPPARPPMVPPAEGPWAGRFENAAIEVGDLLERLSASGGYNLEAARSVLETLLPSRTLDQINQEGFAKYGAYISNLPPLRIEGTTLRVFETREQIAKLRKAVELFRMHGFGQVSLEIRFLRVPKQQLDELGIAWQKARPLSEDEFSSSQFHDLSLSASSSGPGAAIERPTPPRIDLFTFENGISVAQPNIELNASQNFKAVPKFEQRTDFDPAEASVPVELAAPSTRTPAFYAHASANRLSQLLDQAQNEPKTNVLQAPRVTAFNGQIIEIMDSVQRPFVTGVVSAGDTDESNGQPIFQIVRDGVQVITQPIEKPDGKLDLLLALNEQTVQEVETFTYNQTTPQDKAGNTIQTGTTIQIPQILSRYLAIQTELERGESLLATSGISTLHDSQQILIAVVSWQAAEQSDHANRGIADNSAPVVRAAYEPTASENPNIASAFLPPATVSNSATTYSGPEQLAMQRPPQYTLEAGDVIGVSIEGILPTSSKENVPHSASTGFPITVLEDGTISLPLIEAIAVQGRTLPELRQAIQSAYVDAKIVSSAPKVITTLLRKRQYNLLVRRWDQSGSSDPQLIRLPAFENDVLNALMASGGLPHPDVFESVAILRAHAADQEGLEKLDPDELGSLAEPILIRVGAETHIAPGAKMELGEGDQLLVLSRR